MTAPSPQVVAFEPSRFRSTVDYYERYRIPYPPALIDDVARRLGIGAGTAVLDLGCGPGPLAVAFARIGAEVTGIDPEPAMLEAAREAASREGVELRLIEGSSYDLSPALGRFRAVTMGRSFHWMDRVATLDALDGIIEPGGGVVLFGDRSLATAPDWRPLLEELAARHSPARHAERNERRQAGYVPHEAVLLASPFRHLERIGRIGERRIDADAVVGRALSRSVTSPQALGDAREAFEGELRAELARLAPDDVFTEVVESYALVATREG